MTTVIGDDKGVTILTNVSEILSHQIAIDVKSKLMDRALTVILNQPLVCSDVEMLSYFVTVPI